MVLYEIFNYNESSYLFFDILFVDICSFRLSLLREKFMKKVYLPKNG